MGPSGSCSPHVEHVFDRPEVEAPRGVEPTGTNGRRRHSSPFPPVWGWVRVFAAAGLLATRSVVPVVTKRCSRPLAGSRTVTARAGGGAWVVFLLAGRGSRFLGVRAVDGGFCGGHGPGVTPGPFPNPEAKAWHGDGTAPGRVWESNTPPQTFLLGFPVEPTLRETPPFLFPGIHRPRCSRTGLPRPGPREGPREVLCVSRYKPREKHHSCGPCISECMDTLNAYALFRTQTLHRVEQDHVSRQSNGSASCRPKLA